MTALVCPLRASELLAGRGVPHLRRLVPAAGDEAFAVGAERHAVHRAGVPLEGRGAPGPCSASHTFAVLSSLPVTMRLPSGLNATLLDRARVPLEGEQFLARRGVPHPAPSCPRSPVTMRLPSGLNATLRTRPVCPLRARTVLAARGVPHLRRLVHARR